MSEILTDEEIEEIRVDAIKEYQAGPFSLSANRFIRLLNTLDARTKERDRLVEVVEDGARRLKCDCMAIGCCVACRLAAALKEVKGD